MRKFGSLAVGGIAGVCSVFAAQKRGIPKVLANVDEQVPVVDVSNRNIHDPGAPQNLKLLQVQVFFRHGARTPLNQLEGTEEVIYDKAFLGRPVPHTEIPYNVVDLKTGGPQPRSRMDERQLALILKGGMPSGQLTTLGRHQLYSLGEKLKKEYMDKLGFLADHFNTDDVYVRSTNVKRTIESLECVLAGIYGAEHFKNREPVTIPVLHMYYEYLYPNFRNCGTLEHIHSTYHSRLMDIPEYRRITAKIQTQLGQDPESFLEMMKVRDHCVSRKAHGLHVPRWLEDMNSEVEDGAVMCFNQYVTGDESHRHLTMALVTGPLYHMIQENIKHTIQNKTSYQKLHLYSCHDTSVFPLMLILGRHTDAWPPYAADVRFELYEDDRGENWVKAHFCGEEVVPKGFTKSLLHVREFYQLIEPYVMTPKQYEDYCGDIAVAREFAQFWMTHKPDMDPDEATVPPVI